MHFSGGLSLQGNPWLCTCDNTWLGTWLRRWMRETLQLHASIIGRDHHIQTMVRTITCQVPLVSDKDIRVATTVDKMAPLSNSGGQLLLRNSAQSASMNSVQRPLVALSEAETQWTCSAFKGHASAISVSRTMSTFWTLSVLCLLFSIMIR